MAREYYQSIRGNVPSDRVLNNIVYYYKHYFGLDFGKKGSRGIDQAGYSVHNCSDQKAQVSQASQSARRLITIQYRN